MSKRDKYLTEQMGECYHVYEKTRSPRVTIDDKDLCLICNNRISLNYSNPDFSTWNGFGKLFEWSTAQTWWIDFILSRREPGVFSFSANIEPTKFANSIYEYLKEQNND